jgi:putative polyketide hydroxylase
VLQEEGMEEYTPVLVIGGMVSGLSTAVFLAHHGVPCMVVERRAGSSRHPRIRGVSARSMECFDQVGLTPAIQEIDDSANEGSRVIMAESLAGREIRELVPPHNDAFEGVSPTVEAMCDQDLLEPVLHRRAMELGADVRFGTEMVEFSEEADGVRAVLRTVATGTERVVRASYLVAADGTHSPVRERLAIKRVGPGVFGYRCSILFHADLSEVVRGRSIKICMIERFPGSGLLPRHGGRWQLTLPREAHETAADFTEERCVDLIRIAVGLPDLRPQVVGAEPWEVGALVAQRIREGRVFLVGDAAHVMPSTGGFGGNVCIQDAHNLAWKLAAVLDGTAGPALLDTYEQERHPVGSLTMKEAVARTPMFGARNPGGADGKPYAPHDHCSVVFGYRYRSRAVVVEAPDDGEPLEDPRRPSGRPGTRAAHVVVDRDGERGSLLDLYGDGFVLLTGPEGEGWQKAAAVAGGALGVSVACHQFGSGPDDLRDVDGAWGTAYGVGDTGAVLVRPDGFVAWRSPGAVADPAQALGEALERVLCRGA